MSESYTAHNSCETQPVQLSTLCALQYLAVRESKGYLLAAVKEVVVQALHVLLSVFHSDWQPNRLVCRCIAVPKVSNVRQQQCSANVQLV